MTKDKKQEPWTSPLRQFSSEAELQQMLAGLLNRIPEISGVRILQGPQEFGKDIVFNTRGSFGEPLLCACVVKNTRITGNVKSSNGARTILHQAEQAFDSVHTDEFGRELRVEKVYVVTPFNLPPTTIASIKGKLQQRAGQLQFIGGAMLFDLLKQHWPDFLVAEPEILQLHLNKTKEQFSSSSPIPRLIDMYSLDKVLPHLNIYVPQNFFRELHSYDSSDELMTSFVNPSMLERELDESVIDKVMSRLRYLERTLDHISKWGFVRTESWEQLATELDKFGCDLKTEWRHSLKSRTVPNDKMLIFRSSGRLRNPIPFVERISKLQEGFRNSFQVFQQELMTLKVELSHNSFESRQISNELFQRFCKINDCVKSFSNGAFEEAGCVKIDFGKDLLGDWAESFLIVGAPGYGKTSFCLWHARQDAEAYLSGDATIVPIYVPLHLLSASQLDSFEETFLGSLRSLNLLKEQEHDSAKQIRIYLDGLDEITSPAKRREVVELARQGAQQEPRLQIIITSRDYVYAPWLDWLPRINIGEFSSDSIEEFVRKWLDASHETQTRLWISSRIRRVCILLCEFLFWQL